MNKENRIDIMEMYDRGLSLIPVHRFAHDKNENDKRPKIPKWTEYQKKQINKRDLNLAIQDRDTGIALVTGFKNTFGIDFDTYKLRSLSKFSEVETRKIETMYPGVLSRGKKFIPSELPRLLWEKLTEARPHLRNQIYTQTTQSGGTHWIFNVEEGIELPGNGPIAQLPAVRKDGGIGKAAFIETRGRGGYILVYPSEGYNPENGSLGETAPIRSKDFAYIMQQLSLLDLCPKIHKAPIIAKRSLNKRKGNTPAYEYDRQFGQKEVPEMLKRSGWKIDGTNNGTTYYTRPGKTGGTSATWNFIKNGLFVFTSSAPEFDQGTLYWPHQVFAILECRGNYQEAEQKLFDRGLGQMPETKKEEDQIFDMEERIKYYQNDMLARQLAAEQITKTVEMFDNTPDFNRAIWDIMPETIKDAIGGVKGRARQMGLINILGVLSGALQNCKYLWGKKYDVPNIYTYISAPAGARKGICDDTNALAYEIDQRKRSGYDQNLKEYQKAEFEAKKAGRFFEDEKPKDLKLVFGADITKAALIGALKDNDHVCIFTTEVDVITGANNSQHGDFDAFFRMLYHGERVLIGRKSDGETLLENRRLSLSFASTPDQMEAFFKVASNGLPSRFCFFGFNEKSDYRHPNLYPEEQSDPEQIKKIASKIADFADFENVNYHFTHDQNCEVEAFVHSIEAECEIVGPIAQQIRNRTPVQIHRIACILSNLYRCEAGAFGSTQEFEDIDEDAFLIAMEIGKVLFYCNIRVLAMLSDFEIQKAPKKTGARSNKLKFFEDLKNNFTLYEAIEMGETLGVTAGTIRTWLSRAVSRGLYNKKDKRYIKNV